MKLGVHTLEAICDIMERLIRRLEDPELDLGLNAYERTILLSTLRDTLEEIDKEFKGSKI